MGTTPISSATTAFATAGAAPTKKVAGIFATVSMMRKARHSTRSLSLMTNLSAAAKGADPVTVSLKRVSKADAQTY